MLVEATSTWMICSAYRNLNDQKHIYFLNMSKCCCMSVCNGCHRRESTCVSIKYLHKQQFSKVNIAHCSHFYHMKDGSLWNSEKMAAFSFLTLHMSSSGAKAIVSKCDVQWAAEVWRITFRHIALHCTRQAFVRREFCFHYCIPLIHQKWLFEASEIYFSSFLQLFDAESWTYTYLLGCQKTGEAVLIDPVDKQVQYNALSIAAQTLYYCMAIYALSSFCKMSVHTSLLSVIASLPPHLILQIIEIVDCLKCGATEKYWTLNESLWFQTEKFSLEKVFLGCEMVQNENRSVDHVLKGWKGTICIEIIWKHTLAS